MKIILAVLFLTLVQLLSAQKKTYQCERVNDAIKLIDLEKFDEGIAILQECEKIDPSDPTYPYEIAYALIGKKDFKSAIAKLEKIKNNTGIDAHYYQLLGNTYDYDNNPEKAVAAYEEGLKKFPNSGRLYLERGVMYEFDKDYPAAILTYKRGIKAEPSYPSNYYRIANIFLASENKLQGLLYGEIFLNLERTTKRTQEMSEKLYNAYKEAITIKDDQSLSISVCKSITIDPTKIEKLKIPFCTLFEANLALASVGQKELNLNSLAEIRNKFLPLYIKSIKKDYPNLLFDYFKRMEDQKVFDAYNHYIFQIGDEKAFADWKDHHQQEYDKFVDWYTLPENLLDVSSKDISVFY